MVDRIAIKRLAPSDCTLFEAVWRTIGAGNQKSITLNADVLTGEFYPGLAIDTSASENEIALPVVIYGPAAKGVHRLSRKIIKNASYKNWRLNGEVVHGPPDDSSRYDGVSPGDLAVMVFNGEVAPLALDLILVSQTEPADIALHATLGGLFGNKSMVAVTAEQIAAAASAAGVPDAHPIYIAAADPELEKALEDAAQGGFEGAQKLLTNKGGHKVSSSDLAKAKARAQQIGRDGEGLVNAYLKSQIASGQLGSFTWASDENAVAPFDFDAVDAHGERVLIDAKTTNGSFENVLHLSLSEIIEAAGDHPYHLYRIFDVTPDGGKLRISEDIRPLAETLKAIHEAHIPTGVRVDGFSVATSVLKWSAEQHVPRPDEEGE